MKHRRDLTNEVIRALQAVLMCGSQTYMYIKYNS